MQHGSHGTERLIAQSPDLLVRFDRDLRILFANPSAAAAVGCEPQMLVGRTLADVGIPSEQRQMLDVSVRAVFDHGKDLAFEGRFLTVFGERYYNVQLVAEAEHGAVQSVWMASRDITRQKAAEKRLIESERRYRCLFENNLGLICTHDIEGRLLSVNHAAAAALGYSPEGMVGRFLWEFLDPDARREFDIYLNRIRTHGADDGLLQLIGSDGSPRTWKYCNALVVEPGSPDYVLASAQDVTELKRAQETARQMSLTDELTGLLNRRGFLTLAEEHLRLVRRTLDDVLIFYADMDGLKEVNDRHGHDQGSEAIKAVGTLLRQTFRSSDLIARVGGDEFVVLVVNPRCEDPHILHRRLAKNINDYNRQQRHPFEISVSVGTAVGDATKGITLEELVREADAAMYRRKHRMRTAS